MEFGIQYSNPPQMITSVRLYVPTTGYNTDVYEVAYSNDGQNWTGVAGIVLNRAGWNVATWPSVGYPAVWGLILVNHYGLGQQISEVQWLAQSTASYKYDAEKTFKYNNIEQPNRNTLVQKGLADGLKTGHTEDGGYGIVVSALRGGRRCIVVLNGLPTMRQRGEEAERLLDWAFREFENVTLFTAGDTVEQAPVWLGASTTVPLVGGRDLVVTMPRGWREKAKIAIEYDRPIPAPVVRGTTLGRVTVTGTSMPDLNLPLLAGADVPRLGLAGRAVAVLSRMVGGG